MIRYPFIGYLIFFQRFHNPIFPGTTSFPTSDLREREHFCLISFEKCGERGYFIHGEVQDEVINVLFASSFRRRQSTASARLGPAASWLTVTVEVGRDMRVRI